MVESFVTGIVDNWPGKLRKHRRLFTGVVALIIFGISLPMVTDVSLRCAIQNLNVTRGLRFFSQTLFGKMYDLFPFIDPCYALII